MGQLRYPNCKECQQNPKHARHHRFTRGNPFGIACYEWDGETYSAPGVAVFKHMGVVGTAADAVRWERGREPKGKLIKVFPVKERISNG